MNDLISREEAIRLYCREHCGWEPEKCPLKFEQDGTEECSVVRFLKELPSAQPEQNHGKWRDDADKIDKRFHRHDFFCEKCNTRADYFIGGDGNWWSSYAPNYCPSCGATMDMERE